MDDTQVDERDGALRGLPDARVHGSEGFAVFGESAAYSLVVHGTQHPHVERDSVAFQAAGLQVVLIALHETAVDERQRNVGSLHEPADAPQRGLIGLCRALMPLTGEHGDLLLHKGIERGVAGRGNGLLYDLSVVTNVDDILTHGGLAVWGGRLNVNCNHPVHLL